MMICWDPSWRAPSSTLHFPTHTESGPVAQAEAQSCWLSGWLSKAVGERVESVPVLPIPGWYIEITGRGRVFIFNGRSPEKVIPKIHIRALDSQLAQRIAYQLEQRCRNVEPRAYSLDEASKVSA